MLSGGWLGSVGDEGRGKLRKAPGRRMQSSNRGLPNGTSHIITAQAVMANAQNQSILVRAGKESNCDFPSKGD